MVNSNGTERQEGRNFAGAKLVGVTGGGTVLRQEGRGFSVFGDSDTPYTPIVFVIVANTMYTADPPSRVFLLAKPRPTRRETLLCW
jgi:hypothetical protein